MTQATPARRRCGLVYCEEYLRHVPPAEHPESPGRLRACLGGLRAAGILDRLAPIAPRRAAVDELLLVHTLAHVDGLRALSLRGGGMIDEDTFADEWSFDVARLAAGGAVSAVEALLAQEIGRAVVLSRPPGHHAGAEHATGFCLFNNVAVAARVAQARLGVERVLVVDWDAHHGNGTQGIFWRDASVGYFSCHEMPQYPGTGDRAERGEGPGEGFTVNVPLAPHAGDDELLAALTQELPPLWERLAPQLVLVSCGFDAHARDPLTTLQATTVGYERMIRWLLARTGPLPIAFVLEGGYDAIALRECSAALGRACLEG